jgi:hypothetical protein
VPCTMKKYEDGFCHCVIVEVEWKQDVDWGLKLLYAIAELCLRVSQCRIRAYIEYRMGQIAANIYAIG